ncbi:Ger(x)C family spore germination protein [Clostridium ljungdahlii]|uniref:Predicted spore germination protein n=2 Tax=Clostridium ljungdahlii TaxID=1538 RepID=D8GUQ2_CLOLD|nr:Ger(x)C family spore germination protein [Clostridium ljungdahlii]ADK16929.1 predicted spore germination protein [Clostridium ljungdahlii DSM 13528]OAA85306.1 Spore germination protein A3 precursor [Clostridium ljungdahlii DSM 13528]
MYMKFKKILIFFIIMPSIFLTGCWDSREINTLAITLCIGIDKTENGYLVSEQVITPKVVASNKATTESPIVVYTAEGKDLDAAIRSITTKSSRKIYNAHLRMVIFNENVTKDGIKDILDYFARAPEYRTDFYFAITKNTTAKEVLSVLTPIESLPGVNMYKSLTMSNKEWAPTKSIRIIELINSIILDGKNPVLTGIELTSGKVTPKSINDLKQSNGIKKITYTGLGAFKKDKLVGWLNEDESKGYNYITGNVKRTVGYSYYTDNIKITSDVTDAKSTVTSSLVNGKPAINVHINVTQNIGAVGGDFDVSKEESKNIVNKMSEKRIKTLCEKSVHKAQTQLKTDVFGFGEVVHREYPKLWKKIKNGWDTEFTHLPVNITVNVKTLQLGEVTKPFFIKEK